MTWMYFIFLTIQFSSSKTHCTQHAIKSGYIGQAFQGIIIFIYLLNYILITLIGVKKFYFLFLQRIQCKNLTYMNFNYNQYIRELPDLSSATPNIKNLDLRDYTKLVKIHDSVGHLDKLECWDLRGCNELQIFPSCIVMKSLKYLHLLGCKRIKRFPNIPQEMENLKFLSLGYTTITELPPSIGNLTGLE